MVGSVNEDEQDVFLFSSHHGGTVKKDIIFSFHSQIERLNAIWSIGSFFNDQAKVITCSQDSPEYRSLAKEFFVAMEATDSNVILGKIKKISNNNSLTNKCHILKLSFLNYDWLFSYGGDSNRAHQFPTKGTRLLENSSYEAKVFEFIRQELINYYLSSMKKSLIMACQSAFAKLINRLPQANFNLILSNGVLSFVLIHKKPYYYFISDDDRDSSILISTLNINNDADSTQFKCLPNKVAKILVFNGYTLVYNGDISQ